MMMRKMLKRHRVIVTGDILTLNDDGDDDDNDDDDDVDAYHDDKIMIFFQLRLHLGHGKEAL